jgi:large subunit ribosomal protein L5
MSKEKSAEKPRAPRTRGTEAPKEKAAKAKAPTKPASPPKAKPVAAPEAKVAKPKAKKNNIMRKPFIAKVVVNMSLGVGGEKLSKAKTVLESLTGQKPVEVTAKASNRDFGLHKGEAMGCKVTLRGQSAVDFAKRVLDVKDHKIPASSVDAAGNVSFGINEHIQIPGVRYEPELGIFGMDVCICPERPGIRVSRRRRARRRIPRRHRTTPEETMALLTQELGIEFVRPELEEE